MGHDPEQDQRHDRAGRAEQGRAELPDQRAQITAGPERLRRAHAGKGPEKARRSQGDAAHARQQMGQKVTSRLMLRGKRQMFDRFPLGFFPCSALAGCV